MVLSNQGYSLDCWMWDFRQWNADFCIFVWRCNRFSLFHKKVYAELISWFVTVSWFMTKPFLLISYCSRGTFYISCCFDTLMVPANTYQSLPTFYQNCHSMLSLRPRTQFFGALAFDLWFKSSLAGLGQKSNVGSIFLCPKTNLNQLRKANNRC